MSCVAGPLYAWGPIIICLFCSIMGEWTIIIWFLYSPCAWLHNFISETTIKNGRSQKILTLWMRCSYWAPWLEGQRKRGMSTLVCVWTIDLLLKIYVWGEEDNWTLPIIWREIFVLQMFHVMWVYKINNKYYSKYINPHGL